MAKPKKFGKTDIETSRGPTRQMRRRSVAVIVILLGFCFTAIIGRLSYIQIVKADEWRSRAVNQQLSDYVTSASRGAMYDTNGEILAKSATVWTIVFSPKALVHDKDTKITEKRRNKLADDLSVILEVDREKLYERTLKVNSQYEIIKPKVEYPVMNDVSEWITANKADFSGVVRVIQDYKRYYPEGDLLSNVIGFTGTENTGLYGLEAYYEDTLAGVPGRIVSMKNGVGNRMDAEMSYEKTIDAQPGNDLILTIDKNVQYYVEKHLLEGDIIAKSRNGACAIVMDVNTGGVLAMVTLGNFDPNNPMEIADENLKKAIEQIKNEEEKTKEIKTARENQWTNKAVSFAYDPGSVFKSFVASTALEEGLFNEHSTFNCNGYRLIGGFRIRCHRAGGHGSQTFVQAVKNSCNPAFMDIGARLGRTTFTKYHQALGFTEKTGIDMQSELLIPKNLYFSEEQLNTTELATASFGQNFKVTPIQMVTAMSAIANGGNLLQPYVVKQIQDADGNVIKTISPTVKRQVFSEDTGKRMSAILAETVVSGGSKNAYVAGYRMAGKTGTSEKKEEKKVEGENTKVVSSFMGFAPAENPQYCVFVMYDEPDLPSTQRYGSMLAAPIAQKIMTDILPYLGVEPIYTKDEMSNMQRSTPDVTNKLVGEAKTIIGNQDLKVNVVGKGTKVIKQVPEKGASIPRNGMVVIYTEEDELTRTTAVPDFTGKTLAEANALAVNSKLNIELVGLDSQVSEMKAISQSVKKDTKVPLGTVIKITFRYEDGTA